MYFKVKFQGLYFCHFFDKFVTNLEDKFPHNLLLILNHFEWITRINIYS
jgi:hypothetical protein